MRRTCDMRSPTDCSKSSSRLPISSSAALGQVHGQREYDRAAACAASLLARRILRVMMASDICWKRSCCRSTAFNFSAAARSAPRRSE